MNTALAHGATFWNGGEFYGPPERNSQVLLEEYFTKYPENAEKIIYSVKGGINLQNLHPEGSSEGVRRSVDNVIAGLKGKKHLDVFECARVDPKVPIEVTVAAIAEYVKEGKLGGISLSECSADTIRRASKVHKIEFVEVEFSMWATEILDNDVAKTCAELNIPIVAYSPLGRGFLVRWKRSLQKSDTNNHRLVRSSLWTTSQTATSESTSLVSNQTSSQRTSSSSTRLRRLPRRRVASQLSLLFRGSSRWPRSQACLPSSQFQVPVPPSVLRRT